jgi:type I restriction enzyme S subunit
MIVTPETLNLPADWQSARASEHLTLESGQRPSQHVTDDPKDVPSWGGENITEDGFITLENQRFISREYFRTNGKGRVQVGDILINKDGANTGKLAFVGSLPVEEVSINEHLFIIRNKGEFDQRFVFEFLRSYLGQKQIKSLIIGSAQPGLNSRFTKHVLLPKPGIDEQRRIGRISIDLDSAITATRESITKAERLQKGLMQQLLIGRLKADDTVRSRGEFQETKLGLLPRDWSVARVKDFGTVSTGKTPPTANEANFGQDYPFITPGDMGQAKWIKKTERSLSVLGSHHSGVLSTNAVCVVCIGATIGKVGLTVQPACTNQQINTVVCADGHSHEYLYYALRHRARHLQVIAGVNATPQLNKTEFSKYPIPMPATREEEAEIGARLAIFDELVEAKKQKIAVLQRLKKSLMQNLLTGRIRLQADSEVVKNAA